LGVTNIGRADSDNDDNWHYTFGLEENSGWIGHNSQLPGYFTFEVYNPELQRSNASTLQRFNELRGDSPRLAPGHQQSPVP
jgi:hypothetical protein